MRTIAPTVIAESATLKAGKCQPSACRSTKSTTWPKRRRSMTLPSAPPSTRARPALRSAFFSFLCSKKIKTPAARSAKPASSGVCQPDSAARKLNAAPLLNTSTRLKNGATSSRSPGRMRASTTHLTSWSSTAMAAASPNQRAALGMGALCAGAVEVRDAPAAESFGVHVGAVVPAALALGKLARLHLRLGLGRAEGTRRRGEHHVLEIVAEARERFVVLAGSAELDLGLQRRADLAGGAQVLDLLAHRVAQCPEPLPFFQQFFFFRKSGKLVQRLEEHAVIGLAGEMPPELLGREGQDRRHQSHQAVRDVPQRGLG